MGRYLMSVWHDDEYEVEFDSEEAQRLFGQVDTFNTELQEAGAWVFAGGLQPASTASVARSSAGDVLVTDGPYAEAKEQIGGFWAIDAPDFESALEWARKAAMACEGPVELRPFQDG